MKGTLRIQQRKPIELDELAGCYIVDGIKLERVTHWIEQYTKPFNPMNVAIGVRTAHKNKGESSLSPDRLVHYWNLNAKRSNSYGTGIHCFAEMYDMDNENTVPELLKEHAVVQFIKDMEKNYVLVGNEVRIYSKRYKLAGTIDRLLRNRLTNKLLIVDWKSSSNIDKTYNKLRDPFKKYPQSKRMEYELQLGAYKLLGNIELRNGTTIKTTPLDFEQSILVILNGNGTYTKEYVNIIPEQLIQEELEKRADYEADINNII